MWTENLNVGTLWVGAFYNSGMSVAAQRWPLGDGSRASSNGAGSVHASPAATVAKHQRPPRPVESKLDFKASMFGSGVLVHAFPSIVLLKGGFAQYPNFSSFLKGIQARKRKRELRDVASLTYVSARVPNVFCAQPIFGACADFDLLLIFRATEQLLHEACSMTTGDQCGLSCLKPPRCDAEEVTERCTMRLHKNGSVDERPLLNLWRACMQNQSNTCVNPNKSCGIVGIGRSLFHNEFQWKFNGESQNLLAMFKTAFLAIGVIQTTEWNAQDVMARQSRALRSASALRRHYKMKAETWSFTIDYPMATDPIHMFNERNGRDACTWGEFLTDQWRPWQKIG